MKISKSSLIYKIARYGDFHVYENHDLCGFMGSFLSGCFTIFMHSALAIIVAAIFITLSYGLVIMPIYAFFSGMTLAEYLNIPSSVTAIIIWPVIIIARIVDWISNYSRKRKINGTPSIVTTAIKDKLNKVCTRIEFV